MPQSEDKKAQPKAFPNEKPDPVFFTMIPAAEKTPPVEITPPPSARPPRLTPGPLKTVPSGRPAGALSISEMVEKITSQVREQSRRERDEILRANRDLRLELTEQIRMAMSLGIAALAMNALAFIATLALARTGLAWLPVLGLAAVTVFFVGFASAGARRARRRTTLSASNA
jgi:hypothetical protein